MSIESSYEQEDRDAGAALGGGDGDSGGYYTDTNTRDWALTNLPDTVGKMSLESAIAALDKTMREDAEARGKQWGSVGALFGTGLAPGIGTVLGTIAGKLAGKNVSEWEMSQIKEEVAKEMASMFGTSASKEEIQAVSESLAKVIDETQWTGGDIESIANSLLTSGMNLSWSEKQQLKYNKISPALQEKIDAQKTSLNLSGNQAGTPTEGAANTGGTTMTLDEQLKSLLGATGTGGADATDYFRNAMNEFTSLNTDIKFIHDMAELEGVTLSDEEKGFLETMRSNATTNLTNAVNESTLELAETEIARLVDKGVLQGNIGSETLSKLYEKAGKIVGEQSRNIESDVANLGFQTLQQKKATQVDLWGKELTADIANVGAATDKWKTIGTLELGKKEQEQTWNQNLVNALTTMRGQDISLEGAKVGATTNLSMANQEMSAWKEAQDKQMWGNIGSILIDKWI